MHKLAELFEQAGGAPSQYAAGYFKRLAEVMQQLDMATFDRVVEAIERTCAEGRTVFFVANGGSAAVASHFVNDLVAGAMVDGQPPFRALSLTDNGETVTAIANDSGFENIFAYQLKALVEPGDLVIAMSVSGNSENIIRAVQYANDNGARTIGWSGFGGGRLARESNISLHMPTTNDEYGTIEDMFSILEHTIAGYLTMKRGKQLHH
jgi:D-sedoheptulose 7-phosphate isomerase